MSKAIPDRWQDYMPIGEQIEGTRFIAFKVPLRENISSRVENEKQLDDKILLDKIPSLGLIIDLTNTLRYYDPAVFQRNGIKHKKIMIPGKETPPRELSDKFIWVVKDYLERNKDNDKLIGVHCTHGVNRTGYLICNYMISQMTVAPQEAMEKFANARGYKIERKNYIEALQKLPENNLQNGIKSQQLNVQPANWREKHNVQPENWRERHENYKNNYRRDFYSNRAGSRDNDNSRDRYISYRKSRSRSRSPISHGSQNYYERRTDNSYSYRRPSDRSNEGSSNNNTTAGRYADHHCTMSSRRPPVLRLDYYNTKTTYDTKRYSYKRPNS